MVHCHRRHSSSTLSHLNRERERVLINSEMTRNTWRTINEILTKNNKTHNLPTVFKKNGTVITDSINIANTFNTFLYKCRSENCKIYSI